MSGIDEYPLLRGNRRVLMLSTVVMAAAAAAVLVLGTRDARLLRLGLVAALWAVLLGAFAAARLRREISSCAEQTDQLRTVYQRELAREVAARREHTLTIEREFRAQAELSQRREIVELRTELAAMRANLEQLLGGNPLVERAESRTKSGAESACLLPLPAHPRKFDDSRSRAAVAATAEATAEAAPSLTGTEFRFGPGRPQTPQRPVWGSAVPPTDTGISNRHGRHGVLTSLAAAQAQSPAAAQAQRTVSDLLGAHGMASTPRRRRSHDDGPATSGEGVFRNSFGG
jgi:hypothetical protein